MGSPAERVEKLRQQLRAGMNAETDAVLAPFVWDAGQARVAVHAGHQAVYMSGFGTASTYGLPDVGLIGLEEMATNAARIASAVDVPLIADADTGYGNAVNVAHTVERYEAAGVSGLHLEDQVWPKRCGFMSGKEVIPLAEAAQKVAAAVRARQSPSLVIVARTDALEPLGWDAVTERCRAYYECGADLVFVDGLKTEEDILRAAELLPDIPRFLNSHLMSARAARELNYRVVIQLGTLRAVFGALLNVYGGLLRTGVTEVDGLPDIDEIAGILGVARFRELEREFVAASAGEG